MKTNQREAIVGYREHKIIGSVRYTTDTLKSNKLSVLLTSFLEGVSQQCMLSFVHQFAITPECLECTLSTFTGGVGHCPFTQLVLHLGTLHKLPKFEIRF